MSTTFDCGKFGVFSSEALQGIYRDAAEMSGIVVASAKPDVPKEVLRELADTLRALLGKYIVDDRFGIRVADVVGEGQSSIVIEDFASRSVLSGALLGPERVSEWDQSP